MMMMMMQQECADEDAVDNMVLSCLLIERGQRATFIETRDRDVVSHLFD